MCVCVGGGGGGCGGLIQICIAHTMPDLLMILLSMHTDTHTISD